MSSDPFKSSVFFPKPKGSSDVSCMTQCIESGLPVFARDTGKGALKTYFACGYEHFCFNLYRNGTERYRNVYELLQMDKPTKIYLDFDHSDVNDVGDFKKGTEKLIKHIYSILHDKVGHDVPFYILDASTDTKLSQHVIFECFLTDIYAVKNFVQYAVDDCPCDYWDGAVYTRNRLFRLLHSRKFGKSIESTLRVNGQSVDSPYDPMMVFKTMIQAKLPSHYFGPFTPIKDSLASTVSFFKMSTKGSGGACKSSYNGTMCRDLPHGFNSFIELMGGILLSSKENDSFITCIVGGKSCPWKQVPHKNNNQYFTICKSNCVGYFECADPECDNTPYDRTSLTYLWAKDLLSV